MTYFFLTVTAFWLVFACLAWWNLLALPALPVRKDLSVSKLSPRVSVIIAARNEERRIEHTVRGYLSQQDVDLELIVVDDRSTDATGEILRHLAEYDDRLRLISIKDLPADWLGKCYACREGAKRASGDWLLFTDADVHTQPDLLIRALNTAQRDEADHLCLWPGVNCTQPVTRGCVLAWGLCFANYGNPARINRDRGHSAIGVGAFNLVRREAYNKVGGHEPLRMEVIDDVKLGRLLRRAGFRQRIYIGSDDLEVEWALTPGQVVQALEKNWFAGMDYSYAWSVLSIALLFVAWTTALVAPLIATLAIADVNPLVGWLPTAALLSTVMPASVMARRARWPLPTVLLTPLGFVVFACAGINSTWKTWRQGGIQWRETFYSLADLRRGMVR